MRKTAACLLPCAIAGLLFTVALRADEITPHELAALKAKLREAVEAGRLTKKQAAVKFRVITEGHTQTKEKNDVVSVDSRSLPTTSTAGDTEEHGQGDEHPIWLGGRGNASLHGQQPSG